jgi:hypothetical protein
MDQIAHESNVAFTENMALSHATTESSVLDFFSKSGALRGNTDTAEMLFRRAYLEDSTLTLRALCYCRDIRGGQGERAIFRHLLCQILEEYGEAALKRILPYIPEYGRWDDLFCLLGKGIDNLIWGMIAGDLKDDTDSLVAKWCPSENASSKVTRARARALAKYMGLSMKDYRRLLSDRRKRLRLVETALTEKRYEDIRYSAVPSQAARIYKDAFCRHDGVRYSEYLENVAAGKEKINAGTIFPYEIVREVLANRADDPGQRTLEALWQNLPEYCTDPENSIAVVDTSGSMMSGHGPKDVVPITVALSLGLYFAQRNKGRFGGYFITFSSRPQLVRIPDGSLWQVLQHMGRAGWEMNTDLQAVFDLILFTAQRNNVPDEELPRKIYIISDMQFDGCCRHRTNFQVIAAKYAQAGYTMPKLVFWNVRAGEDQPVTRDEQGTYLVSGCSPSILKYAMNCESVTPYSLMLEVLNSPRYSVVK